MSLKPWAAYQVAVRPRRARARLLAEIDELMLDPRPESGEALPGYTDRRLLRLGPYRIVYAIDEEKKAITIFGIGYRQARPRR